jgi:transposase InsO family protein
MPLEIRLDNGSRMRRESHVRFCERLQAKFLRSTYHNSPTERFFRSLKYEQLNYEKFRTKEAAKLSIIDYLAFYNGKRTHSKLGYESPLEFERLFYKKAG